MFFKVLLILASMAISTSIHSADDMDPLSNVEVSNDEIIKSLEAMKASGQISALDYEAAKKQLSGMSSAQVKALSETAIGLVRNDPDKAVELTKGNKIDPKEVQKQIDKLSKP